jgi:hypothetical protein
MLDDSNSYIRARGIHMIAANAKWDKDFKLDEIIDKFLEHILDEKPVTARQCIQLLPMIAEGKPNLKEKIVSALLKADPKKYKETILIFKDIEKSLELIGKI